MGDGDAEPREIAVPVPFRETGEVVDQERQVHTVEASGVHGGVVQRRAAAVANRAADHAKNLRVQDVSLLWHLMRCDEEESFSGILLRNMQIMAGTRDHAAHGFPAVHGRWYLASPACDPEFTRTMAGKASRARGITSRFESPAASHGSPQP